MTASPLLPDGWQLAPVEPTQEMVRAAYENQPDAINVSFAQCYRDALAAAPSPPASPALILPDQITPAIADALGIMIFVTGPTAEAFRSAGHQIERKAEAEQSYILFWALKYAVTHGTNWREACNPELTAIFDKHKAAIEAAKNGVTR